MELDFKPHYVSGGGNDWQGNVYVKDTRAVYATVYGRTEEEAIKNALLIAAGPQLLAALEMANQEWGREAWSNKREQMVNAIALAKTIE